MPLEGASPLHAGPGAEAPFDTSPKWLLWSATMATHVDVLIAGAGISRIFTPYHLKKHSPEQIFAAAVGYLNAPWTPRAERPYVVSREEAVVL